MSQQLNNDIEKTKDTRKTTCKIEFIDRPTNFYNSGETLYGLVTISFFKEKTIKGIFVDIHGTAKCNWIEGIQTAEKKYSSKETFLREKICLFGGGEEDIVIPAGVHTYTFTYQLPIDIPSSTEGTLGRISYNASCHIHGPGSYYKIFMETFEVIKPYQQTNDIVASKSIEQEENVPLLCCLLWCYPSSPVNLTIKLPCTFYTPGQNINFQMEAHNRSHIYVKSFIIQLVQIFTYTSQRPFTKVREVAKVLEQVMLDSLKGGHRKNYDDILSIPSVPPTEETISKCLKVRYEIQIRTITNFCVDDTKITVPIVIGTASIEQTQKHYVTKMIERVKKSEKPTFVIGSSSVLTRL